MLIGWSHYLSSHLEQGQDIQDLNISPSRYVFHHHKWAHKNSNPSGFFSNKPSPQHDGRLRKYMPQSSNQTRVNIQTKCPNENQAPSRHGTERFTVLFQGCGGSGWSANMAHSDCKLHLVVEIYLFCMGAQQISVGLAWLGLFAVKWK